MRALRYQRAAEPCAIGRRVRHRSPRLTLAACGTLAARRHACRAEPAFKNTVLGYAAIYGGLTQLVAGLFEVGGSSAGSAAPSLHAAPPPAGKRSSCWMAWLLAASCGGLTPARPPPAAQIIKGNTFAGCAFASYGCFWIGWFIGGLLNAAAGGGTARLAPGCALRGCLA